jgi:hypothetical protein
LLIWRLLTIVIIVTLILTSWSVAGAMTAPGTDSVAARLAEWGRDHGFEHLITWLEKQHYKPPRRSHRSPPRPHCPGKANGTPSQRSAGTPL